MLFSDKEYNYLSDQVYEVDSKKNKTPWQKGDKLEKYEKVYRIVNVEDNQSNGMQAMAVAPMVNGEVDTSHIIIVYAGTKFEKQKVIANDS